MSRAETIKHEAGARFEFMMTAVEALGQRAVTMTQGDVLCWKKPDNTHVTEIDLTLNREFIEMAAAEFPDDLVWGEEESNSEKYDTSLAEQRWLWSIDPIDSTRSLVESIQAKRLKDNTSTILLSATPPGNLQPVMGVVHSPFRSTTSTAYAHEGRAYYVTPQMPAPMQLTAERLRHTPLRLEDVERFESSSWKGSVPDLREFGELLPSARKVNHRLFMASVALGDVDISVFPGPSHPHDVAPGALIVHNAGGDVRSFDGMPYSEIDWRVDVPGVVCTATPELSQKVIERVQG